MSDTEQDEPLFLNRYRCPMCDHEWDDTWSCACDDECPECGAQDISPYEYTEVDPTDGAKSSADDPHVRRFYDLSTAHLSAETIEMLDAGRGGPMSADPVEYGWLVWINEDEAAARGLGVPEEMLNIFRIAKAAGCDYILFDRDAPLSGTIPVLHPDYQKAPNEPPSA